VLTETSEYTLYFFPNSFINFKPFYDGEEDFLLRNLQFAVSEDNVDNYLHCLADSAYRRYEFVPAQ